MNPNNLGPRSDAWGVKLTDPAMTAHQGKVIQFAREKLAPCNSLFFIVFDSSEAVNKLDHLAWNGWYRFDFRTGISTAVVGNVKFEESQSPPELRLSGMDLLTVPYTVQSVAAADAPFKVYSNGAYINVIRQSTQGTLYLNRLLLTELSVEQQGETLSRFALEASWETRFKYSGKKDVPSTDVDNQSFMDPTGRPFVEPTIELEKIHPVSGGLFDVLEIPTANPDTKIIYIAVNTGTAIQLYQIKKSTDGFLDYSESNVSFTPIIPILKASTTKLPPLAGMAPALGFYAEQESATSHDSSEVELQRMGRLVLAIPVGGGPLSKAMAIFDYVLDQSGNIANLSAAEQTAPLVDGTIVSARFVPDLTSPTYPTALNIASAMQLRVSTMILGQIEPQGSPTLFIGDDGLLHLYYGGPPPTTIGGFWTNLDPNLPQAMVAQYDTRVNHLVLPFARELSQASEQPVGNVYFNGSLSGVLMSGASVVISATTFNASAPTDLCDIAITYPAALQLSNEVWVGVPREVTTLASILNGTATDDAGDPSALIGERSFFDFEGKKSLVRVATSTPSGYASCLQFVSSLEDIELTSVNVSSVSGKLNFAFAFVTDTGIVINFAWDGVPTTVAGYADIFSGVAGANTYTYPNQSANSKLWSLNTAANQIDTPLVFYAKISSVSASLTINVTPGTQNGTVNVSFNNGGSPINLSNVPADVSAFVSALKANTAFTALNLGIASSGASGNIVATGSPVGMLSLADSSMLFDLLLPDYALNLMQVKARSYAAGKQSHVFTPTSTALSFTKMAAFLVTLDLPDGGMSASVKNSPVASESPLAQVNRTVHSASAPPLHAGLWIRQDPQNSCSFTGTQNVLLPVSSGNNPLSHSINLQPQWEWTLETWVKPIGSQQQQVISFHNGTVPVPAGSPTMDYALGLKGQKVFSFGSYANPAGMESAYLLTGVSPHASFYPKTEFTWECWIQPDAAPTPASGAVSVGVIFQFGDNLTYPAFSVGLANDRKLHIQTLNKLNQPQNYSTTLAIPALGSDNLPVWSHVSLIGTLNSTGTDWTIKVALNGDNLQTFPSVLFHTTGVPRLIIGGHGLNSTSMFGKVSQLRYWGFARSLAEIRRSWLTTLTGYEYGLLGSWPMGELKENSKKAQYFENGAYVSGSLWDAVLFPSTKQPHSMPDDSFFLSVLATVGGLPAVEAPALAINGGWNHFAITFEGGGALSMNPASHFGSDWMEIEESESLSPGIQFAIDAWVIVPAGTNLPGTIAADWNKSGVLEDCAYKFWVDLNGALNFDVVYIESNAGDFAKASFTSSGFKLDDGLPHHIAATFSSTKQVPHSGAAPTDATYTLTVWLDGKSEPSDPISVADVGSVQINSTTNKVLIGRDFIEPEGSPPIADENILFFRGVIGQLRYWNTAPSVENLFPERYPRLARIGVPKGVVAQWNFREQEGFFAKDSVGGSDGKLSTSAMWSSLTATSKFQVYSNGALIGSSSVFGGTFSSGTSNQLSFGSPDGTVVGLTGEIAQVSIYDEVRSMELIRAQQFVPREGSERGLVACWNFKNAGEDITGGQNNAKPAIAASRITASDAPITNEGPYVRNIYGGLTTEKSRSAPGRISVANYFDVMDVGTLKQQAVLKRQFIMEAGLPFPRPVQIGELDLTFIGQVQTDPTLIGYIEGAPPVPSENLTRPYYENPVAGPYMRYLDTSMVSLVQESADSVSFTSVSNSATQIDLSGAFGIMGASDTDISAV